MRDYLHYLVIFVESFMLANGWNEDSGNSVWHCWMFAHPTLGTFSTKVLFRTQNPRPNATHNDDDDDSSILNNLLMTTTMFFSFLFSAFNIKKIFSRSERCACVSGWAGEMGECAGRSERIDDGGCLSNANCLILLALFHFNESCMETEWSVHYLPSVRNAWMKCKTDIFQEDFRFEKQTLSTECLSNKVMVNGKSICWLLAFETMA